MKSSTLILAFTYVAVIQLGKARKFEGAKLDIMVLVDQSGSIGSNDYKRMVDVVSKLPESFPLGPTKSRIALAAFSDSGTVMPEYFTDNGTTFASSIDKLRNSKPSQGATSTHLGLKTIMTELLPRARIDVTKVLIVLTDGCTNAAGSEDDPKNAEAMKMAEDVALVMRNVSDVRIFLVYIGSEGCPDGMPNIVEHQLNIVGRDHPDRRIAVTKFDDLSESIFDEMGTQLEEEPCVYKPLCYYPSDSKTTCESAWQKDKKKSIFNCIPQEPNVEKKCSVTECEYNCETDWSRGDCGKLCTDMPAWCTKACKRCRKPEEPAVIDPYGTSNGKSKEEDWWMWLWIALAIGGVLLVVLIVAVAVVATRWRRQSDRTEKQATLLKMQMKDQAKQSKEVKPHLRDASRFRSRDSRNLKEKKPVRESAASYENVISRSITGHRHSAYAPSPMNTPVRRPVEDKLLKSGHKSKGGGKRADAGRSTSWKPRRFKK